MKIFLFFLKRNFRKKRDVILEIPERIKKDKNVRVETLPEGGVRTWIKGIPHPFPGFPTVEKTSKMHAIKGVLPMAIETLHKALLGDPENNSVRVLIEDPKHYCATAREIYRLFNLMIEREKDQDHIVHKWRMMRDVICTLLEYDDSYRFRFQDVFSELDKEQIKLTEADEYFLSHKNYKPKGIDKQKVN